MRETALFPMSLFVRGKEGRTYKNLQLLGYKDIQIKDGAKGERVDNLPGEDRKFFLRELS